MFNKIEHKIDDIRQQPENVRLRYVWFSVIISMLFVIFIWLLSMQTSFFQLSSTNSNSSTTSKAADDLQKRIDSINNQEFNNPISVEELITNTTPTTP